MWIYIDRIVYAEHKPLCCNFATSILLACISSDDAFRAILQQAENEKEHFMKWILYNSGFLFTISLLLYAE